MPFADDGGPLPSAEEYIDTEIKAQVAADGGVQLISDAMNDHSQHAKLQYAGCATISALVSPSLGEGVQLAKRVAREVREVAREESLFPDRL